MKKKYRDITVGGKQYAWMVRSEFLTIWLNKKEITSVDVSHCTVTPKLVEEIIKGLA